MTGIDFVHAPLEKREAVSLVRGQVQELLPRIAAMEGVAGCVLLATCNRTELYLHGAEGAELDPLAVLAEAAGFDAAEYRGFSIQRTENEAVHHLMKVAAGLESQIFGDDQIVSQVKGAVALAREAKTERGTISTYDGTVLARSEKQADGTYERVYPAGDLASHVVGYASTRYGTSGIEAAYNETLKGQQNFASWTDVLNSLAGINAPGNDIVLTLNSKIQQAAQDALAGEVGACVVMDPETGAVLALASSPTYAAQDVEALIQQAAEGGGESSSELYNRATQALYAPGSTFKMVTLATALQDGVATEETLYDSPAEMDIGNAPVSNVNDNDYGTISLARATEVSSNTVYGQLGVQIGAERLVSGAERFGFNESIDFDLPLATSLMPDPDEMTEWETAWAAAGEPVGTHESPAGPQATVLEMAMVGSAIANGGTMMQPYLVDGIYNANGERSYTGQPTKLMQAIDEGTAERVLDVLKGVVTDGSGAAAAVEGVSVAGKTGTAERGDGTADSWFVGIAPAENPRVVVAIVIEKGDSGEGAQKAQNVLKTALEVQGLV